MTTLAITLPLVRRNPVRIPRRDLSLSAGDAFALRVSLVEADRPDAAPLDLLRAMSRLRLRIWDDAGDRCCDYGFMPPPGRLLLQSASTYATAADPTAITVEIPAAACVSICGRGRLVWSLQGDTATLCWGVLQMHRGLALPPLHMLTDDGANVLTDAGEDVLL